MSTRVNKRLSEVLYNYVRRTTDRPFISLAKTDPDSRTFIIGVVFACREGESKHESFVETSAVLRREPVLEAVGRLYEALKCAGYVIPDAVIQPIPEPVVAQEPEASDEPVQEKPKRRRKKKEYDSES